MSLRMYLLDYKKEHFSVHLHDIMNIHTYTTTQ